MIICILWYGFDKAAIRVGPQGSKAVSTVT